MDTDLAILGGGPGGYVCAIRAAQLGLNVVLVEEADLGGTCLHWGCIPTKALYSATKLLAQAEDASRIGISFAYPQIDLERLAAWKGEVVSSLTAGIDMILEKTGVRLHRARGTVSGAGRISLATGEEITAGAIVLATGSNPMGIPGFPFDHPAIWSSNDALQLAEVPDRLAVIGGGVIGLELATIYRRLGSEVLIIELLPEILSSLDLDRRTVAVLKRALSDQGMRVLTSTVAERFDETEDGVLLYTKDGESHAVDRILVAVGRRPRTDDLGLETCGVALDPHGFIQVDDRLQTTASGIFAIGDLVRGPMLAHKASTEGIRVAEFLHGEEPPPLDLDLIPQAIFTDPEIASVGLSEATARSTAQDVLVGRFPFAALGKALGMREESGFFQIVARASDHRILGVQIIGAEASDLISEAAVAIHNGLTLEGIADAVHPHPTLPEGLKEASENALGRAIHTINR
jgi:dihydrolipoamide dehydrogenase